MNTVTTPLSTLNIASTDKGFKVEMTVKVCVEVGAEHITGFVNAHDSLRDAIQKCVKGGVHKVELINKVAQATKFSEEKAAKLVDLVFQGAERFGAMERLAICKFLKEETGFFLKECKIALDIVYPPSRPV